LRLPATTFIITHSPFRSNRRNGFTFLGDVRVEGPARAGLRCASGRRRRRSSSARRRTDLRTNLGTKPGREPPRRRQAIGSGQDEVRSEMRAWRKASILRGVHSVLRESLGLATSLFAAQGRMGQPPERPSVLRSQSGTPFRPRGCIQRALHRLTERQEVDLAW